MILTNIHRSFKPQYNINLLIFVYSRPPRPTEGEGRTWRRKIWEFIHHFGGRIAVLLALTNISLGVFFAVAHKVVWIIWYVYLGILVLVFIMAEIVQECLRDRHLDKFENDGTNEMAHSKDNKNGAYRNSRM